VRVPGAESSPVILEYGVPQGSVLGPLIFILYSSPLNDIISRFGIKSHFFSDDTQLYMSFPITTDGKEQRIVSETTSDCIAELKHWTDRNKMKFNVGKTDTILVYSGSSRIQPKDVSIEVGEENIKPSLSVRNLGFTLDSNLTLENHIKGICKRAHFYIQRISRIRRYLDPESTTRLMSAFVLSLFDNGNSILFGLPDKLLKRLQSIQHAAARVVSGRREFDHISDVLRSLHCLPMRFRTEFKIATLVFRCVSGDAPSYLRELVKPYQPTRELRSGDNSLDLVVPRARKKKCGERTFSRAALLIWNELPLSIRSSTSLLSFRARLKTHLFNKAFNSR
jgi:hypothetical protein